MIVRSQFKPAWWLPGAHLQTIVSRYMRRDIEFPRRHEVLPTPDNDELHLAWVDEGDGPIVIVLHGLGGSFNSPYVKRIQRVFKGRGWRSVAVNFRGAGGIPNNLARSYHSGETGDIHFVYETILNREPDAPIAAVGTSLGGNVLLKWLGEGRDLQLKAAATISVPMLLNLCADQMDQGFAKAYRKYLTDQLIEMVEAKIAHLNRIEATEEAEKLRQRFDLSKNPSFWEFDDKLTAPLHGFKDADEYYRKCSSRQYLKHIQTPTLIIHAENDPFMTPDVIPSEEELSDQVTLELSASGGHMGFTEASWWGKPSFWVEDRIPNFISKYLDSD